MRHTWMGFGLVLCACASMEQPTDSPFATDAATVTEQLDASQPETDAAFAVSGTLRVLTYNVAGLPIGVSSSNPLANTPIMSPLLNQYDLVLAQEDFSYHDALKAEATHPYQSTPMPPVGAVPVADGLNRFSNIAFDELQREEWDECNSLVSSGNDCLAPKGFSVATHTLAPGVIVDIYNMHTDAGRGQDDRDARNSQVAQVLAYIESHSAGHAVLLAGDTNMKQGDEDTLQMLLTGASLTDACMAIGCPNPEVYDRIMIRSSDTLSLSVEDWWIDTLFVDSLGQPLSDHPAIGINLHWASE